MYLALNRSSRIYYLTYPVLVKALALHALKPVSDCQKINFQTLQYDFNV